MIHSFILVIFMISFAGVLTWTSVKPTKRSINYVKTLKNPKYKKLKICVYVDLALTLIMYIFFISAIINSLISICFDIQYINISFLIIMYIILFILSLINSWLFKRYKSKLK